MGCVYKITNKINGKMYIGYTTRTLDQRWKQHINCAFNPDTKDDSYNHYFKRAIRRYGVNNFVIEPIEFNSSKTWLQEREKYWIQYYNTFVGTSNSNGYNMTTGGDGGNGQYQPVYEIDIISGKIINQFSSETTAAQYFHVTVTRISQIVNLENKALTIQKAKTLIKKNDYDSKNHQELIDFLYTRYNIICQFDLNGNFCRYYYDFDEACKSANISPSTLSFALSGIRQRGGLYQWCYYSDKSKKTGHKLLNIDGNKAVAQYSLDTNKQIAQYKSAKEAGEINNLDASAIGKVCKHKRKSCGGYRWEYITE